MALPASGNQISLAQVNTELGAASTTTRSLNDSVVRTLFGVSSGAISMSNGFGKANAFSATISTNQTDLNLRSWALANGWNGSTAAIITVASGVYIYATSTANAGLIIDGSWPGGITLINNGFIIGKGGLAGGNSTTAAVGFAGGPAISLATSVTIANNSYIAGGGGGGGCAGGGGGAGGGDGGSWTTGYYGGTGGAVGAIGGSGTSGVVATGGGGGRILPGSGGAAGVPNTSQGQGGGSGGGGGGFIKQIAQGVWGMTAGGGGGGWGAAGGAGATVAYTTPGALPGAGGSGNAVGVTGTVISGGTIYAGGTGGNAVALNGYTVTWSATGTIYGAVT